MTDDATAICKRCGCQFTPKQGTRGVFCSMQCMRNRVTKVCPQCGITFEVMVSKQAKFRYCSLDCRRGAHPPITKECPTCGCTFSVPIDRDRVSFCSYACQHAPNRVTYTCAWCGSERTVPRYRMKANRRCCSNRCATLLRMSKGFEPGYLAEKRRTMRRTDIEAMAEKVLIELDISYEFEKKIGRWSIDFALTELGIALECDGWQHAFTTEKDAHRDASIAGLGWTVVRVDGNALRSNPRDANTTALQPHLEPVEEMDAPVGD